MKAPATMPLARPEISIASIGFGFIAGVYCLSNSLQEPIAAMNFQTSIAAALKSSARYSSEPCHIYAVSNHS